MIQCTLRFLTIVFLLAAVLPSGLWASSFDRGLVALTQDDGSVYITWRLFASDSVDCSFVLKRDDGVTWETDLCFRIDYNPPMDKRSWSYKLYKQDSGDMELCGEVSYRVGQHKDNFIRVPFDGNHDAQKVGIGDLDGDGEFEYVIKQPNFNTDPYQQPGYWKKSTTTYKLEAYETDGTLLWRYDMGWSIEAGIWYSPWLVYDVDQDGKAEVYTKAGVGDPREPSGQVKSGPEYLVKLDGKTGKVIQKTNWISRDHYSSYN